MYCDFMIFLALLISNALDQIVKISHFIDRNILYCKDNLIVPIAIC